MNTWRQLHPSLNRYISLLNAEPSQLAENRVPQSLNRYISLLNAELSLYSSEEMDNVLIDTYRCLMQNSLTCYTLLLRGLNRYISLLNAEQIFAGFEIRVEVS